MVDPMLVLTASDDPALRLKASRLRAPCALSATEKAALREAVRSSPRVQALLSERTPAGGIPLHPYSKWRGAHWVLAALADLGYPTGDAALIPLREQVLDWLLSEKHRASITTIGGRTRRCASQEGNASWALLTLGLADARVEMLIDRLIAWQWPDGGWNCDKRPEAVNSSYHESWLPLRALALYARRSGSRPAALAAEAAAELLLKRRIYLRLSDGQPIKSDFIKLAYPSYWRYNIQSALTALAEAGYIGDPRCSAALDLLESKRLPDGGFPAEARYWSTAPGIKSGRSMVKWGQVSTLKSNPFVTADALYVLKSAGRWP